MSSAPAIIVSSRDYARLDALLESPAHRHTPAARALMEEMLRAEVREPQDMPADVVTMNAAVTCVDELGGETHRLTLVYPDQADAGAGRVSVLAPVGSALLGLSVGQRIDWEAPDGRRLRLRVTEVHRPPESASEADR